VELDEAHQLGVEPTQLLRGLMEALHAATRTKAGATADALLSAEEREDAEQMGGALSWGTIHRLWQMLLKGLQDVQIAPEPREAAEMALLRLMLAADLPDPGALVALLAADGRNSGTSGSPAAAPAGRPTARLPADFRALVQAVETCGKHLLAQQLHDQVSLIRFEPPVLVLKPLRPLGSDWPRDLAIALKAATGATWQVTLASEGGEPSLLDQEKMAEEKVRGDVLADPNVRAVIEAFPGAELETFSTRGG